MAAYDRKLVLENGEEYYGFGFGAPVSGKVSELVFQTSMMGYQEVVADPAYAYKTVVMTYSIIGNYGLTDDDTENRSWSASGLVVREYNNKPSNFRYTKTLAEQMEENGVPGLAGVDTRKLTRVLRDCGTMKAVMVDAETAKETALAAIAAASLPENRVRDVSCEKRWHARTTKPVYNVAAIDCGSKTSAVRALNTRGCNVTVVPWNTPVKEILELHPDGIFVTSGPGNPEAVGETIETIRALKGTLPIFGVGLGCTLAALACGAKTVRLPHGHHGGSTPVRNLKTNGIESTMQNHDYAVDAASLEGTGLTVTYTNVMDGSVEGVENSAAKLFGVCFDPEGTDSPAVMAQFMTMLQKQKNGR